MIRLTVILLLLFNNIHASDLHIACKQGNLPLLHMALSDPDVDVNKQDYDGTVPLHVACIYNDIAIVRVLLQHKSIQINLKDGFDKTPLDYACFNNHIEVVEELLDHEAAFDKIKSLNPIIKNLFIRYKTFNKPRDIKNTLVDQYLCTSYRDWRNEKSNFFDFLITTKGPVQRRIKELFKPAVYTEIRKKSLFNACRNGSVNQVAELLQNQDVDPNVTFEGKFALSVASRIPDEKNKRQIQELLLAAGANQYYITNIFDQIRFDRDLLLKYRNYNVHEYKKYYSGEIGKELVKVYDLYWKNKNTSYLKNILTNSRLLSKKIITERNNRETHWLFQTSQEQQNPQEVANFAVDILCVFHKIFKRDFIKELANEISYEKKTCSCFDFM